MPVIITTIMMTNMPYSFHNASGNFDKSGIARLPFHLFVWLLATLRKNGWTDFNRIFKAGYLALGTRDDLEHFRDVPFFTFTFLEESVCLQHSGTMVEQIFIKRMDMWQGTSMYILGMLWLNHTILDRYLFPGLIIISNLMEKRMNRFSWRFHDPFNNYLDFFTPG